MNTETEEEKGANLEFDRLTYGFNRQNLEEKGERIVRDELNSGKYGDAGLKRFDYVSAWLADKDFVRTEELSATAKAACAAATASAISAADSVKQARLAKYITIGVAAVNAIVLVVTLCLQN